MALDHMYRFLIFLAKGPRRIEDSRSEDENGQTRLCACLDSLTKFEGLKGRSAPRPKLCG